MATRRGLPRAASSRKPAETDKLFDVVIGLTRRVGDRVCQAIIDGSQSGRIRIAQVTHLNRRRLQGKDLEASLRSVSSEIDKDIDAVSSNLLHNFSIIQTESGSPRACPRPEASRDFVGCC